MKSLAKNRKRRVALRKETRQAVHRRYTWHLRPPFGDEFDRSQWWKGQPDVEPVAALYELARRHPLVVEEERILVPLPGSPPPIPLPSIFEPRPSLVWTRRLRMKSWLRLTKSEQDNWKSSLHKMKGLDFRPKEFLCRSITEAARSTITQHRAEADKARAESGPPWFACYPPRQPADHEWKTAIAQCAVEAHRQGYLLLAVSPDMAADKAQSVMAKSYREHLKLYPSTGRLQRERSEDWLTLISEFEKVEAKGQKDTRQAFVRYRRALDGILFT
jgi:hypothetical protein